MWRVSESYEKISYLEIKIMLSCRFMNEQESRKFDMMESDLVNVIK